MMTRLSLSRLMAHPILAVMIIAAPAVSGCGGSTPAPITPAESVPDASEGARDAAQDASADLVGQEPADRIASEREVVDDSASLAVDAMAVVVLPAPPFERYVADEVSDAAGGKRASKPRLVEVSVKRNQITDSDRWLQQNQLTLPVTPFATGDAATPQYLGQPLRQRIDSDLTLSIYGSYGDPRAFLVATDPADDSVRFAFDLSAYAILPGAKRTPDSFITMELSWAWVTGDRLYLSHSHRTYADSSNGINAFITALRIPDGKILWQSRPLVNNADNFALVKAGEREVLVTGYGFTSEPDFLFLLDPDTGAILHSKKLRKGPSYIIPKDERIYVRTYDRDYVFRIKP